MIEQPPDGSICPACQGLCRRSPSYPAALCRDCEARLVDWAGRPVRLASTSLLGTGVELLNGEESIIDEDVPIFIDDLACWARESRFGGIVVQPVAEWLRVHQLPDDSERLRTLSDFEFDGRAVLNYLVAMSPWRSTDQAIASLSIFAHPNVIAATGRRAIFRTVRGHTNRGKILDGVMLDDNYSPAMAFEWSTGFKKRKASDLTCCHLYANSRDPASYTDLRNIFYTPNFIAKLTDCQAVDPPLDHALHILRYRAFVLYGYTGPGDGGRPSKPDDYDQLRWSDTVGAGTNASDLENSLRARLRTKRKDRVTKSVARCGWTFSEYQPDSAVIYSGQELPE